MRREWTMFVYFIWVKILEKVDFGEIKCGKISDVISEFIMLLEVFPHLISPKSTLQNFYSNQVCKHSSFSSHAFPKFSVRYFIYKKSSGSKK